MHLTKWLLNQGQIVMLYLILNSNESQSSHVEMTGEIWSKRNVIKDMSIIKTQCN